MAKTNENYILEVPINTKLFEINILNKRFRVAEIMYNKLLSHALNILIELRKNKQYKEYLNLYINTKDNKLKKEYSKELSNIRNIFKLTEYDLQAYGVKLQRTYKVHIDSLTMQKIATTVYNAIEDVLFKNGKKVHFKKYNTLTSIEGKNDKSGIKFRHGKIVWLNLNLNLKAKQKDLYIKYILDNNMDNLKYTRIVRKPFNKGYRYFAQFILGGIPPCKEDILGLEQIIIPKRVGIDIGTSTIAVASEEKLILKELAPNINKYNEKIEKLQQQMDLKKRLLNPNKYNKDSTINKTNKDKWIYSKNYNKLKWQLKNTYRKKSSYIKQHHEILANEIINLGSNIYVEQMSFSGLSKRSKTLKRNENKSIIKKEIKDKFKVNFKNIKRKTKQYKEIEIYKYNKQKRYGKSINNRAPSMLISIINRKLKYLNEEINKINTQTFKASQYNHVEDKYIKKGLNERTTLIGKDLIQRDLYSAYLIQNSKEDLKTTDRDLCINGYERFKELHNNLIKDLKEKKISNKNFGLRDFK